MTVTTCAPTVEVDVADIHVTYREVELPSACPRCDADLRGTEGNAGLAVVWPGPHATGATPRSTRRRSARKAPSASSAAAAPPRIDLNTPSLLPAHRATVGWSPVPRPASRGTPAPSPGAGGAGREAVRSHYSATS